MESSVVSNIDRNTDNNTHAEGPVAKAIGKHTAKVPSDVFLWTAIGAMGVSAVLKCLGKKHNALFVGQWAAPLLLLGVYNKIVKTAGHDQERDVLHDQQETDD